MLNTPLKTQIHLKPRPPHSHSGIVPLASLGACTFARPPPLGRADFMRILCGFFVISNLFAKSSPSFLTSLACGLVSKLFANSQRKNHRTEKRF